MIPMTLIFLLCYAFSFWKLPWKHTGPLSPILLPGKQRKRGLGNSGLKQAEWTELEWDSLWLIKCLHFPSSLHPSEEGWFAALVQTGAQAKAKATGGGAGVTENQSDAAEPGALSAQQQESVLCSPSSSERTHSALHT